MYPQYAVRGMGPIYGRIPEAQRTCAARASEHPWVADFLRRDWVSNIGRTLKTDPL